MPFRNVFKKYGRDFTGILTSDPNALHIASSAHYHIMSGELLSHFEDYQCFADSLAYEALFWHMLSTARPIRRLRLTLQVHTAQTQGSSWSVLLFGS